MDEIVTATGSLLMWGLFTAPIWLSVLTAYFIARWLGAVPGIAVLAATAFVPKIQWWICYGRTGGIGLLDADRQAFNQSRLQVLMVIWAGYALLAVVAWWAGRRIKPA